jgi:hypothetical protein
MNDFSFVHEIDYVDGNNEMNEIDMDKNVVQYKIGRKDGNNDMENQNIWMKLCS